MKKIIVLFVISLLPIQIVANVVGVWDWHCPEDPREIKIILNNDSTAIYKISNIEPINAKWEKSNDTINIRSENFVWDYKYKELIFPKNFIKIPDDKYMPNLYGKVLKSGGYTESYIYDSKNQILVPISIADNGYFSKSEMSKKEFEKFIPIKISDLLFDYYIETEIEEPNINNPEAKQMDDIYTVLQQAKEADNSAQATLGLLTPLPSKVDSIQIMLINYGIPLNHYFAIDRQAFNQTFEYLKNDTSYNLVNLISNDPVFIDNFCKLMTNLQPFPTEGIFITPNNVWRSCKGFKYNHGIILEYNPNIEPLEIRGKLILFSDEQNISCYFSNLSIDYKNHRYILSKTLSSFFLFLSILNESN